MQKTGRADRHVICSTYSGAKELWLRGAWIPHGKEHFSGVIHGHSQSCPRSVLSTLFTEGRSNAVYYRNNCWHQHNPRVKVSKMLFLCKTVSCIFKYFHIYVSHIYAFLPHETIFRYDKTLLRNHLHNNAVNIISKQRGISVLTSILHNLSGLANGPQWLRNCWQLATVIFKSFS